MDNCRLDFIPDTLENLERKIAEKDPDDYSPNIIRFTLPEGLHWSHDPACKQSLSFRPRLTAGAKMPAGYLECSLCGFAQKIPTGYEKYCSECGPKIPDMVAKKFKDSQR